MKEVGRSAMLGLKLPPREIDMLRPINPKQAKLHQDRLNLYLRILLRREELMKLECVQTFLKVDIVVMKQH